MPAASYTYWQTYAFLWRWDLTCRTMPCLTWLIIDEIKILFLFFRHIRMRSSMSWPALYWRWTPTDPPLGCVGRRSVSGPQPANSRHVPDRLAKRQQVPCAGNLLYQRLLCRRFYGVRLNFFFHPILLTDFLSVSSCLLAKFHVQIKVWNNGFQSFYKAYNFLFNCVVLILLYFHLIWMRTIVFTMIWAILYCLIVIIFLDITL